MPSIGKNPDPIPASLPTPPPIPARKPPELPKRPSPKEISAKKAQAAFRSMTPTSPGRQDLSVKQISKKTSSHPPIGPKPHAPAPPIRASAIKKTESASKVQKAIGSQRILPMPKGSRPTPPTKSKFLQVHQLGDSFRDKNGTVIATEQATLVNTKDLVIRQLKTKIEYLTNLRNDTGEKHYDEQSKEAREQLEIYQKETGAWASTNAPRFLFQNNSPEQARKKYLPSLGNFWMQTVKDQDGQTVSRIGRSAAISDFSHGRVSLKELEDYQDLVRLSADKPIGDDRAKDLLEIYNLGSLAGTSPVRINAESRKQLNKLINKLKKRIVQDYGEQVIDRDGSLKPDELAKITSSRKDKLQQQILQDLFVHFQSQPVLTNEIVYGRTALIDSTKKASKEASGFVNSERTQMLDMHAIYSEINGKQVFFDVEDSPDKGPYFDKDGNIHMNRSFYRGKAPHEPVNLNTVFLNISAQGNTQNMGMQRAINTKALADLEKMAKKGLFDPKELEKLKTALEDPRSNAFKKSLLAMQLISKAGYASENCFGGKDRTGYAVAFLTSACLEKALKKREEEIAKETGIEIQGEVEEQMSKWDEQLLSNEGVAAKIIKHNTGHTTLKLTAYKLDLYHTGTRAGRARRIADYYKGLRVLTAPKTIPSEAGKRQMYSPFEQRSMKASKLDLEK